MKKLLLTTNQAAILAGVDRKQVIEAHRQGKLPQWNLPKGRRPYYDARDIERVFGVSLAEVLDNPGKADGDQA
jgi:hypothetical protein